ncbi:MAG: prepilin-type N-terminal cleavage/methylation domain-containing protein [Candidatus Shapirobacteria bacterium]|nr:prepilin-type N-terminal cleavage/methylation domain-containing protein [Candidatus Shapirobacteria bacterium]MDD5073785.1 prepilin-type N-terminal cleavage/methylation domain-containing protein [Candidatus Shapirobacteria bacterium]MDD5481530.1 prepilin-type N-terminal cleavage/methylation domain-containing protein [Candidatus Shapirobacteria bacterium]
MRTGSLRKTTPFVPVRGGFTLIELLIAVVIIGILAAIGLGQFHTAQIRSRDAQRKENLSAVAKALEMYYGDHSQYPVAADLSWGFSLEDEAGQGTVYMKDLPNDPSSGAKYDYEADDNGSYYKLYAYIEHGADRCFNEGQCLDGGYPGANCGQGEEALPCHYCLASPNASCQE